MRNGCFTDNELIKDEVDDMEESLGHYESGYVISPKEGRPISRRELSEVLKTLRDRTVFTIEYDEGNKEEYIRMHIPVLREFLISAEVEQELFFHWGNPAMIHWNDSLFEPYTEYCYYLSEILKPDDYKRTKRTIKRRLKRKFNDLYTEKDGIEQFEFDNLCDYFISVGRGMCDDDCRKESSFFSPYVERMAKDYASCIIDIVDTFSAENVNQENAEDDIERI